jgi:UDP-glucose 4-epimerase
MTVPVNGGAGFIGSRAVHEFTGAGEQAIVLGNLTHPENPVGIGSIAA